MIGDPSAPLDHAVEAAVRRAISEDLGSNGDVTTECLFGPSETGRASIVFREDGVLAGTWTTDATCAQFDLDVSWHAVEGERIRDGQVVAVIGGALRGVFAAERTILNFLRHLSGIATATRAFVDAVGDRAVIRDTRKTTPGLRVLEKAAVRSGGGINHRMGLYDAVLIKDNHVARLGGDIGGAVERAVSCWPGLVIEVEADTMDQAVAAADAGADLVLLDNMAPALVAATVERLESTVEIEISGGVTIDNVSAYADTGADFIAVGAITHSAPAVDIGLDVDEASGG